MHRLTIAVLFLGSMAFGQVPASRPAAPVDIKKLGAFGFPQKQAKLLCDEPELRVAAWNNSEYLYVQAIVWKDGDDGLGETSDGRPIGDSSTLCVDVDADQKITPKIDRNYTLNPWPSLPGLRYSVLLSETASTHIMSDSKGRGSIRYLDTPAGEHVRVESYLIPLAEIDRHAGDEIRMAYFASSPKPALNLSSVADKNKGSYSLSRAKYHSLKLADRTTSFDAKQVSEGREDQVPATTRPTKPAPKLHTVPPELAAKDWMNTDKPPTLKGLQGKVVLLDFWATWCGPCVAGIPHMNELHDKYGAKGLFIIGVTDQSKRGIENFVKTTPMKYALATGSALAPEYGVAGFPHAFIIGRDGKLAWEGNPGSEDFDKQVVKALEAK